MGGNIANCLGKWKELTSDPWILEIVSGFRLPFWEEPFQEYEPRPFNLSESQSVVFQKAVQDLLEKNVVEESVEEEGQFLSNIFVRPKPNGKLRLILTELT